jgi:GT2 family glycosyltransferase
VNAVVVIPTFNARDLLAEALASLGKQTVPASVVVVDNASTDGTGEMVRSRFPEVTLVRNSTNMGFGRAVNRGVAAAPAADVIVLVNNDVVCEPEFVARMLEPLESPAVGMVAGVLLQASAPELVDTAGIELDATLGAWDVLWNQSVDKLAGTPDPMGPCGGAAAYRAAAFRDLGGFDETLFAYWEDVDLALRMRQAGWLCRRAPAARALHRHGATLGAASPAQRRLQAFGRGYLLQKYGVPESRRLSRLWIAVLDWPVLAVHLVVRREMGPIRARARGMRAGRTARRQGPPMTLASVSLATALRRQYGLLWQRLTGSLPEHFAEHEPQVG